MSSTPPPPPIVPPPPVLSRPTNDAITTTASDTSEPETADSGRTGFAARMTRRRYVAERPGQLTLGWTTVFWIGWLLVGASFGAVWYSSYLTGFATWWLGPESEPHLFLLVSLPFIAPLALCVMALRGVRRLPWFGIGGAVVTAAIALGDLGARTGYVVVELGLAVAGMLVSVASFAGMLHSDEPSAVPVP